MNPSYSRFHPFRCQGKAGDAEILRQLSRPVFVCVWGGFRAAGLGKLTQKCTNVVSSIRHIKIQHGIHLTCDSSNGYCKVMRALWNQILRSHGACAALVRLGKGGRRCCAGQREGESSFGADFGTVDQWMSIQSLGKRVDESASAETSDM